MTDNKKTMLEKADKIAIAVAIVMFLAISAGLMNEANKMHKKYDIKEDTYYQRKQFYNTSVRGDVLFEKFLSEMR